MWPKEGLCGSQWWPLWHDSRIFWSPLKTTSMLWVRWTPCCEWGGPQCCEWGRHPPCCDWGGGFSVLLHESVPRISQLTVAVICICFQFWKCFALRYHGIVSWYLQCSLFFYLLDLINSESCRLILFGDDLYCICWLADVLSIRHISSWDISSWWWF